VPLSAANVKCNDGRVSFAGGVPVAKQVTVSEVPALTQPGFVAIGVAQEFQSVWIAYDRSAKGLQGAIERRHYGRVKEDRRAAVTTSVSRRQVGLGFASCRRRPLQAICDQLGPADHTAVL